MLLGAFAKLQMRLCSFIIACPFASVRTEQVGSHWMDFREIWHLSFSKICQEISGFIEIWQEQQALYMNTYLYLWCLAEFFLEFEMFQVKVVQEIKPHFMSMTFLFNKSCCLCDNVKTNGRAGQATDDSV
jgi:hypothetical protein